MPGFKLSATGKNQVLGPGVWGSGAGGVAEYLLYVNSSNFLSVAFLDTVFGSHSITSSTTLGTSTTHHAAVVFNAGTATLYLDGVSQGTATWTGSLASQATADYDIGKNNSSDANNFLAFNGSIDEVRVSKTARYTSGFSPTTTQFTPDANTISLYHFNSSTTTGYTQTETFVKTAFTLMPNTPKMVVINLINHQGNRGSLVNVSQQVKYINTP